MKARLFTVILAVFAFCSVASAQAYLIRVEGRNNLRSCAGFDCRVVETAPIGTVLEVVGEYNRWLKINRNGAEVWMANWIDYTRVEPGEQTSAPSVSDVDNCCFLDWLCVTDDDWQSGFQAFQNNQCKHPGVAIEGSAGFIDQMEAALDMLKDRTPQWYDYVISGLDKIKEDPESNCICVSVHTRTYVAPPTPIVVADHPDEVHILFLAAGLAHEACHVHRYEAGFPDKTDAEIVADERACVEVQLETLEAMDIYSKALSLRQWYQETIENIENPEYWWWADD